MGIIGKMAYGAALVASFAAGYAANYAVENRDTHYEINRTGIHRKVGVGDRVDGSVNSVTDNVGDSIDSTVRDVKKATGDGVEYIGEQIEDMGERMRR